MNKYLLKQSKEKAASTGVDLKTILIDEIQSFFLEEFYKNPASNGVVLFGGGRFRHLNNSIRFSLDLDFFKTKGFNYANALNFISGKFIDSVKQKFGVQARIIDIPPWQKIHNIETIRLLVYDNDNDFHQIEIDFDFIMREPYLACEKALVGNIVVIAGNAEESLQEKIISVYERNDLKIRDIFDFWYFRNLAGKLNKKNIQKKLTQRGITQESIKKRLNDFSEHRDYYLKEIKNIIKSCGEKREEVQNLLKLDINIILDHITGMTKEYLLSERK